MSDEDDNGGEVTRPADVQVGYAIICIRLEGLLDILSSLLWQLCVRPSESQRGDANL